MRRRISNDHNRLCRIRPPLQLMQRDLHRSRHGLGTIPAPGSGQRFEERVDLVNRRGEGECFGDVGAVLWWVVSVGDDLWGGSGQSGIVGNGRGTDGYSEVVWS